MGDFRGAFKLQRCVEKGFEATSHIDFQYTDSTDKTDNSDNFKKICVIRIIR